MDPKIKERAKDAEVFIENDEVTEEDKLYFEEKLSSGITGNELLFFQEMKEKTEGEFAPSADLILGEDENEDELYIVRHYYCEYEVGKGFVGRRSKNDFYVDTFKELMESDLFGLLGVHTTVYDWLKKRDFKGIRFDGNYILTPEDYGKRQRIC